MNDTSDGDGVGPLEELDGRLGWSVPEVAASAVLLVVGLLAAGGLATGIVTVAGDTSTLGLTTRQVAGSAIGTAASWANPLLAVALIGVLGVAWVQARSSAIGVDGSDSSKQRQGATRTWRAWQLRRWALVGLLVTSAGSVAELVGALIMLTAPPGAGIPSFEWAHDILLGAGAITTLMVASAGIWIGARVRELTWTGERPGDVSGDNPG